MGMLGCSKDRNLPQQRKLKEDLSHRVKHGVGCHQGRLRSCNGRLTLLSQNKKVIVAGDDLPVASRILKEPDGLPKETPGFLSALRLGHGGPRHRMLIHPGLSAE